MTQILIVPMVNLKVFPGAACSTLMTITFERELPL